MNDAPETPFSEAFDIGRGFNHGWAALKRCFPVLFVGGCLKACVEGNYNYSGGGNSSNDWDNDSSRLFLDVPRGLAEASDGLPSLVVGSGVGGMEMGIIAGIVAIVLVVVAVFIVFRAWLVTGWMRVHQQIVETGEGTFPMLFSGADRTLPMLGWSILSGLVMLGTVGVALIPAIAIGVLGGEDMILAAVLAGVVFALPTGIYVGLGLSFGEQAVGLDGMSAMDALSRSWSLADGNRIGLFIFRFVFALIRAALVIAGICALCVGALITIPASLAIHDFAITEAYLAWTRPRAETQNWSIWSWQ